jgi:hypothetical protein
MSKIELTKVNTDGTSEVLFQQVVRDNTSEITELLCELNIIDDFNDKKSEKIIELAMALSSHDGKLNIQ